MLVPPRPDAEKGAELMDRLEKAGRRLAARATATTGRAARDEARHVLREAWRLGIEHQVRLDVLSASGLLAYDTPRAGWEPELLRVPGPRSPPRPAVDPLGPTGPTGPARPASGAFPCPPEDRSAAH
ncbi:hypothetical protein ACWC4J_23750 [Streptomyces sp. NPDC001356]